MVIWVEGGETGGREAGGSCLGPEEDLPWVLPKERENFTSHPECFLMTFCTYLLKTKRQNSLLDLKGIVVCSLFFVQQVKWKFFCVLFTQILGNKEWKWSASDQEGITKGWNQQNLIGWGDLMMTPKF